MKTKTLFMLVLLAILLTSCNHSHLYKPGDTVKYKSKEYLVVASYHHHIPHTWLSVSRTQMSLKIVDVKSFDSVSTTFIVRDISVFLQICIVLLIVILSIAMILALHAYWYVVPIFLFVIISLGYVFLLGVFAYILMIIISLWWIFCAIHIILHFVDIYKK